MNFKEIIKQEWEKEFNPGEYEEPVEPYGFESSVFQMYNSMVERICIKVWNQALELAADNADVDYNMVGSWDIQKMGDIEVYVLKESILKFKL